MKISFFNWVHLLAPFILVLIARKLEFVGSFPSLLCNSLWITFAVGLVAPFASGEEATGRSFRSKGGAYFKEYQEVQSDFKPESNYYYIVAIHFLSAIVIGRFL